MKAIGAVALFLNFLFNSTGADVEVSCVLAESCVLPCSFPPGTDPLIHWIKEDAKESRVHSYYEDRDQFENQNDRFRNRTWLFRDQISRGNASIRLTGLLVQDQGRYQCYTSTVSGGKKESYVNLHVYAPVGQVHIEQGTNSITCHSEGIYPEPSLSWSTSPPPSTFQNTTEVRGREAQLYDISSSLTLSHSDTSTFNCTVSTGTSTRTAILRKGASASVTEFDGVTTIHCSASNFSSLVWHFNHSQIIVTRAAADGPHNVSQEWRTQVKDVSKSGGLTLGSLSTAHTGVYTCELSDGDVTLITNTGLQIIKKGDSPSVGVSAGIVLAVVGAAVVGAVVVGAVVGAVLHVRRCRRTGPQSGNSSEHQAMNRSAAP